LMSEGTRSEPSSLSADQREYSRKAERESE
jgi:hypothetical protein